MKTMFSVLSLPTTTSDVAALLEQGMTAWAERWHDIATLLHSDQQDQLWSMAQISVNVVKSP